MSTICTDAPRRAGMFGAVIPRSATNDPAGIAGRVVQSGKPAVVPKISDEPMFLNKLKRERESDQELSFICVPIAIGNSAAGALSADRYGAYS